MKSIKQINIENCPYYFFNDMINIKNFYSNLLNIDKISFNIRYITMKYLVHADIDSENPLHLIYHNIDGYIEESNGNKCLTFASTGKNKEVLKKYT